MKFMKWAKDGGPHSTVHGLYVIEIKSLFSVVFLRFSDGSREAYHSHAFNAFSWVLAGTLREYHKDGRVNDLPPISRWLPFGTYRNTYHKVVSVGTTWAFTIRGPWRDRWEEYLVDAKRQRILTHGRREV